MSQSDTPPNDEAPILYELRDHVAVITFNRPRAMNAVNVALATAAGDALEQAEADPDVRAVVLTGAGRAFCAGADLKAVAAGEKLSSPDHPEWDFAGIVRHWISKPVIAAVNGFALGGGTEIVLTADMAVMDAEAQLGLPEVRRGLVAAAGGLLRIHRQVPQKIASEIVLTGRPLDANRAYELGLVNAIAPAGGVLDAALELAAEIVGNAPLAVAESKRVMHESARNDRGWDDEAWAINLEAMKKVFRSEDAREGPRAFAEKRAPEWTGR